MLEVGGELRVQSLIVDPNGHSGLGLDPGSQPPRRVSPRRAAASSAPRRGSAVPAAPFLQPGSDACVSL